MDTVHQEEDAADPTPENDHPNGDDQEADRYWKDVLSQRSAWTGSAVHATLPSDRVTQVDALTLEAQAVHHALSRASQYLNDLQSPIMVLPDEILAFIFEILAIREDDGYGRYGHLYEDDWPFVFTTDEQEALPEDATYQDTFERCYTERLGWLTVTHVCRRFRRAAIDHKLLWSHIIMHNSFPWREFLERSGDYPVTVTSKTRSYNDPDSFDYADYLGEHMHHIRELDLEIATDDRLDAIKAVLLTKPAPQLLTLNLYPEYPTRWTGQWQVASTSPSSERFLDAPALERLSLERISLSIFPWYPSPHNLRTLKLNNTGGGIYTLSLEELCTFLARSGRLESVEFQDVSIGVDNYPIYGRPDSLHLPSLRHITLRDCNPTCVKFWDAIAAPPTVLVFISCSHLDEDFTNLFVVRRAMRDHLARIARHPGSLPLRLHTSDRRGGYKNERTISITISSNTGCIDIELKELGRFEGVLTSLTKLASPFCSGDEPGVSSE